VAFSNPYGRFLVAAWIVPMFYLPGADYIFETIGSEWNWYWRDVFYYYYGHIILVIAVLVLGRIVGIYWKGMFGNGPDVSELFPSLKLTFFIFLFSIAAAYALFVPLSYVAPDFVQWWYIDAPQIIYSDEGVYPILANILSLLSLVVIAPILEEVVFRGMLLHRWSYKWNLKIAIIFSSLLFGIIHTDPIGAFVFGVGMCIIYLRTQSLYIPILCHSVNNLVVWIIEAGYIYVEGPDYKYTLEALRNDWYIGIVCGVIVTIWAVMFLQKPKGLREWKLPAIN
jgi:membrane protease YdiL (CAAX protease family)